MVTDAVDPMFLLKVCNRERRVPLTPEHVKVLTEKGVKVLIQPSESRIFKDIEYQQNGAVITQDLSPAKTIFGIKEFPEANLIPNRGYVIFSHVIKAQTENMPFLDACLKKGIRLFDYECIRNRQGRLVAFGRYAGNAGMLDLFRGLGEKLLSKGFSTPFIAVPSAYMHNSLDDAVENLENIGKEITRIGLPDRLSPMVFAFTGSGNVTKGALEMFELLPHEMISVADVIELKKEQSSNPKNHNRVYGVLVKTSDLVQPINEGIKFSREHYYACPEQYEPILHKTLLPYTNVIVNGIYWDHRFPRILTSGQARSLPNLFFIGDFSCDNNGSIGYISLQSTQFVLGSIQFLSASTNIESPFFTLDPATNSISSGVAEKGITVLAVDNLPAELPREASQHFSQALVGFAEELSKHNAWDPFPDSLSHPMRQSCIVSNGALRPDFDYITALRDSMKRSSSIAGNHSATITIDGHLFDTGLINAVLDSIETMGGHFKLHHLNVEVNRTRNKRKSHAVIDIVCSSDSKLNEITSEIILLTETTKNAEGIANIVSLRSPSNVLNSTTRDSNKRVLLLGAGFVAGPVVELLAKLNISILVASDDIHQAELVANVSYGNVDVAQIDGRNSDSIEKLIRESSLVISLLPADFHVSIARLCISCKVNLLTASYVSPEMAKLDSIARDQGIILLNECGLDPGLDHMSAMQTIERITERSGSVSLFESVCGGLPSPEAADNPFGYKFSWSPRGALLAALSDAKFKKHGETIHIKGNELLASAQPLHLTPALNLEHYPNRDSLPYATEYGLQESASTFYRGTIRYVGYSSLLCIFNKLGFLNIAKRDNVNGPWPAFLRDYFKTDDIETSVAERIGSSECLHVLSTMRWLGMLDVGTSIKTSSNSIMDAFCGLLENKLKFQPGERDMVILRHRFKAEFQEERQSEEVTSTLTMYGSNIGHSAMAQTVGIPVALAANLILEGAISKRGVLKPTTPDIYKPILAGCAERGIIFLEKSITQR